MTENAGRRMPLSTINQGCGRGDYIEGTISRVTLTQYNTAKPNAKVAHALITETVVCLRAVECISLAGRLNAHHEANGVEG